MEGVVVEANRPYQFSSRGLCDDDIRHLTDSLLSWNLPYDMCDTSLPHLDFNERVSAHSARQDKVEICHEHRFMMGTVGEVDEFFTFLGAANEQIFRRPSGGYPPYKKLIIRSGRSTGAPVPLFSGSIQTRERRHEQGVWRLFSELSLNPSRFLQHQDPNQRFRPSSFEYSLFTREVPLSWNNELPFIGNDNWIPDVPPWRLWAAPRFWRGHLRRYLMRVIGAIDDAVEAALESAMIQSSRSRRRPYSLYSAETYWEFYADDPLSTVRSLRPLLDTYCSGLVDERDYPVEFRQEPDNSPRLLLETSRGEFLKIYAKTNYRVRFEVMHNLSCRTHSFAPDSGHTFTNQEGVLGCLDHLAEIAADRINHVLNHFRLNASSPDNQHTVLRFIADFQSAFRDHVKATTLLQVLVNNGSIVVGNGRPLGKYFHDELKRLVRIGVLMGSNRRYSVMPRYRQALQCLQEDGRGVILGARIRRRRNNH